LIAWHPHDPVGPFGYLFGIVGALAWLAIIAGVVVLVIWAIRVLPGRGSMRNAPPAIESPEDILARRFAMGEISAEDFARTRELLRGEAGSQKPTPTG
jgi:putative membrane protein